MPIYTPHQSTYFAHKITLEGLGEDALAQSLSTARVDMNPHQVDAALFSLSSPLSNGVIFADEVGLGKTIEASLVIAQKWAERRRRILLIVPASLRKQWAQELQEKFSLTSVILESRGYNRARKDGMAMPFDQKDKIVVTSYEFAATKADEVGAVHWDLVVYDEAHRLRNVYKKGASVRAKRLRDATRRYKKLLLTATPLQNSLLELYGLVSVIDEHFFGDESSFKANYTSASANKNGLNFLRKRLEPICKRTLRRQVQQAGLIKYTERKPLTFEFSPSDEEVDLYTSLSAYLQRPNTIAFGEKANALVTLVVRKIMGSSTFAVAETLAKVIDRLKRKQRLGNEALADYDLIDEVAEEIGEEDDESDNTPVDPVALAAEIAELEGYRALALRIGKNAKAEALIEALPKAMNEVVSKGGNAKAVIFTESVRTQTYLASKLIAQGYENDIVLLNGQNNDPHSLGILKDWLSRHKDDDAVSESKSANLKAAVVEAFRDEKKILIATESGAEGINLQFCSLVFNYDLPWNPQRVEQRIGRCHRYGQKIDVTVVNFLNLKNRAEARVYELLDKKFRLFEGVFGASDEVLGVIERGVDIERRILEIVQKGRSDDEIDAAFDQLQLELQSQIDEQVIDTRKRLLESIDEQVVRRLKDRNQALHAHMSDIQLALLLIAQAELPNITLRTDNHFAFDYQGQTFTTEWPLADERGWKFFRLIEGSLGMQTADRAKTRAYAAPQTLTFNLADYGARLADVEQFKGTGGWLRLSKLKIVTPAVTREYLIPSVLADNGQEMDHELVDRLFKVPATASACTAAPPTESLTTQETKRRQSLLAEAEQQNANWLDEESEKLDGYADDLEKGFEAEVKALGDEIKEAKRLLRGSDLPMAQKLAEKRRIGAMEAKRDKMKADFFDRRAQIRAEVEAMLDKVQESLQIEPSLQPLFTVRWEIAS